MQALFEANGAQSKKPSPWTTLFIESFAHGLYTNRNPLTAVGTAVDQKFYGGKPGSLFSGLNTEISIHNTIIRRYGNSTFSTAIYPTPVNRAFSFPLLNNQVEVLIDSGSSGALTISSVAASSGGSAVYTGVFPAGGSSAYAGLTFLIAGLAANNNGTWVCTASSTTTLTLT